ncbi:MAG: hypothetical protein ABSH09_05800 [Bryobacteraceae bacterium]|jgi:hypothetical protein
MEQWFRPMGLNLRVSTDDARLAQAVGDAYGAFGGGDAAAAAGLQFDFELSERRSTFQLEYRMTAHSAELLSDGGAILSVDATGCARGRFPSNSLDDRSAFRLHVLQFALAAALSTRGFLGVHAACLSIGATAVLLRGPRGVGKSVLAYAAASRGFRVIAGSTVWIAPDGDNWWGFPRWIYLRPSALTLFPEIASGVEVVIGDEVKVEIDLGPPAETSVRPGIIVFLDRSCREMSVPRSDALSHWKRGEAGNEASAPDYEKRISRLLARPLYRLNPDNNIGRVWELIASIARDHGAC